MTSFARTKRLSDLWRLTFFRKFGAYEKSKDCQSRTVPETCSSSTMGENDDLCPPYPSPRSDPPFPCPKPPMCDQDRADPRKLLFWRMMSLFVALPLVMIMSVITYARQKEKAKQPREPFLNLPYMYRRTKPFPWGDGNHSLFHNPVKNPVPPYGYEVEDPNETPYKKVGN
ncbi:Cytochrome c oxidase subunit 6A1, mitochondrial [Formica fusca]